MKKLNITREQFNRSNYFRKKYGKLEYVSESGKLFKTNKGNVLKFKESGNLVKEDENHRYSIKFVKRGWDCSVQEDAPSEEEAIAIAIDKGKIKSPKDVVKVTDLGVPGSYWKESKKTVKETWERYPAANGCTIHDCGDCFVVTNKNGTTIGQCNTMTEAETIAEMCSDEMKNKPFLVSEGNELTEDAILDAIPVDARDGLIDINEPDGSFGRYTWYVRFAPFSDEEAKEAADGIKNVTGRRTQVANFGKEIYVVIMDYPSRPTSESRKLVKEGAGAGYTVEIKDLKFGKIVDYKLEKGEKSYEDSYKVKVEIKPGNYEIAANDYYNDYFWQEHEFGDTPTAQIDGGYAIFDIALDGNPDEDDEAWFQLSRELQNRKLDISFDYGWGWTHANLPREEIEADHVDIDGRDVYFGIDKLVLNAPDLADAVNSGYQSTFDQGEEDEEDEDGEPVVNEVSGWKLEDEDLTLVNSESDGNKLYIVKLWWGSGYQMDCYNAYAFNEEEALNYVVAYIEKEDPGILERSDEAAATLRTELADENGIENSLEAEDLPEFQETFMYVDATMEGASDTHYIWAENLKIAEYPKDHDYPRSKDIKRADESYDPKGDDGRKRVMDALEEFRQVLWDDTKVDDEEEHDLRRSLYNDVDNAISQAIQKYFKYSRLAMRFNK